MQKENFVLPHILFIQQSDNSMVMLVPSSPPQGHSIALRLTYIRHVLYYGDSAATLTLMPVKVGVASRSLVQPHRLHASCSLWILPPHTPQVCPCHCLAESYSPFRHLQGSFPWPLRMGLALQLHLRTRNHRTSPRRNDHPGNNCVKPTSLCRL